MKHFISLFAAIVLALPASLAWSSQTRILSLEDCIELALSQNQQAKSAQLGVQAANYQLDEARANFWPVLEYQYRTAPVPTQLDRALASFFEGNVTMFNALHLGVGIPISGFGQLKTAQDLARSGIAAARQRERKDRSQVVLEVKKLYYGLQLASEVSSLVKDAIKKINNKLAEEEAKEVSDVSPIDLIKLKLFRQDLTKRLREIEDKQKLAQQGLRIQLGLSEGESYRLSTYKLKPASFALNSSESYVNKTWEQHPDSQLVDIGVEVRKHQYQLQKKQLRPKAGVGAFIDVGQTVTGVSGLTNTDDFSKPFNYTRAGIGLQISGKIDFHGALARIRKSRAEYFKASLERSLAKQGLELRANKMFLTAKRARDEVRRAEKRKSLARQMYFLTKSNRDLGIGDDEKYADALKLLLLSRGEYFKTVFYYNVQVAELDRATGMDVNQEQ